MMNLHPVTLVFSAEDTLSLIAAGYRFPRTEALFDSTLPIEGCDVRFEEAGIGDINSNLFSGPQTYDFTEIGLHVYVGLCK